MFVEEKLVIAKPRNCVICGFVYIVRGILCGARDLFGLMGICSWKK